MNQNQDYTDQLNDLDQMRIKFEKDEDINRLKKEKDLSWMQNLFDKKLAARRSKSVNFDHCQTRSTFKKQNAKKSSPKKLVVDP